MNLTFETEQKEDGRWLAKVPGVLGYGATKQQANVKADTLALGLSPNALTIAKRH